MRVRPLIKLFQASPIQDRVILKIYSALRILSRLRTDLTAGSSAQGHLDKLGTYIHTTRSRHMSRECMCLVFQSRPFLGTFRHQSSGDGLPYRAVWKESGRPATLSVHESVTGHQLAAPLEAILSNATDVAPCSASSLRLNSEAERQALAFLLAKRPSDIPVALLAAFNLSLGKSSAKDEAIMTCMPSTGSRCRLAEMIVQGSGHGRDAYVRRNSTTGTSRPYPRYHIFRERGM